ncbi:hypothetical protein BBJ28_00005938 [Nothophytophthora sp. Chile5]|nr:hypothetical protein BBJ28_00005938 [Nothophytophthora sp. Chile5]
MPRWRKTSALSRLQPLRSKQPLLPWLLLLFWTKVTVSLRRWFTLWVRRPLMRLGIASDSDESRSSLDSDADLDVDALRVASPVGTLYETTGNDVSASKVEEKAAELPSGLVNMGNMCFVNAVAQCLAVLPGFLESVERAMATRTQLHVVTRVDDDQTQKLLVAETLISLLRGISPKPIDRVEEEEDADDDILLNGGREKAMNDSSMGNKREPERQHFLRAEQWCLKKLKSYNPNDPRSYMLAVGAQSLAECLEHFRHPEQLTDENRVYCDGYCHAKTSRLTQILLQRVPPVLVLQLQRFQQTSMRARLEKVDTAVSFPCGRDELLDLTMNAFFRDEEKRVMFRLVAVCAHLGSSIDSGHYVAYVRHPEAERETQRAATVSDDGADQRWLRIDDDLVSVIDEATLRNETLCTAYLLFYELVGR